METVLSCPVAKPFCVIEATPNWLPYCVDWPKLNVSVPPCVPVAVGVNAIGTVTLSPGFSCVPSAGDGLPSTNCDELDVTLESVRSSVAVSFAVARGGTESATPR